VNVNEWLLEVMGGGVEVQCKCDLCGWIGIGYYSRPFPMKVIHTCRTLAPKAVSTPKTEE
jgi:hypothetical protein